MDYVVGSVAALISGNVTPNRPKLIRRALTPTKHQQSPNVTPKSEFVEDRSIFLSPTLQKKKAIVKKSPKRIFQNPDLDTTENENSKSPQADKVKKHLKDDLESDEMGMKLKSPNSSQEKSFDADSPASKKSKKLNRSQDSNENISKKKKKINSLTNVENIEEVTVASPVVEVSNKKSPKKLLQRRKSTTETESTEIPTETKLSKKSKKKLQKNQLEVSENLTETTESNTVTNQNNEGKKKKNKKKNKTKNQVNQPESTNDNKENKKSNKKKKNKKSKVQENIDQIKENIDQDEDSDADNEITDTPNPNAITAMDTDSEHGSDDEIDSENEEINKDLLQTENADSSDEEEEQQKPEKKKQEKKETKVKENEIDFEDEIKRTIFVGNVPLSQKTRKEIKKIFKKYGDIQTVRIRFVPVKDARVTPKMAVIKNELHPERSTVNVYVKFADASSVEKALSENNTVLNGHHLRVSRSGSTGAEHDPRLAVFVGNLPFGIEDDQLRTVFDKCGEIHSVRIVRDKKTNAGKGFGYVNFASKDGVELALNLAEEDLTIKNRILRVKRSTQTLGQGGKRQGERQGKFNGQGKKFQGQGRIQGRPGQGNKPGQHDQGGRPGHNTQGGRPGHNTQGGRQGHSQGNRQRQLGQGRPGQNSQGGNWPRGPGKEEGAQRRIMNKRKFQESSDGPPNKKQHLNQPSKEKKQRKEFVGVTADKKKKQKFNKGLKKKKVLSEILTKKKV